MKGFTLIELLVVVLIIGILSSVALPQYTKAVEKSRQSEAWTTMKSINDAIKIYQMEKGNSSALPDWDDMVISFSNVGGGGSNSGGSGSGKSAFSFGKTVNGAWAKRTGGSYSGYGLMMTFDGQRYCKGSNCTKVGSKTSTVSCPSISPDGVSGSCYSF